MTPQERTGLFLNGNYKLTDNVEVYAVGPAQQDLVGVPARARSADHAPGGVVISADSYYNPFGIDYRSAERQHVSATRLVAARQSPRVRSAPTTDQVSTGFKGSFGVWNDQQWNWEVGMDYGHVSVSTHDLRPAEPQHRSTRRRARRSSAPTASCIAARPDAPITGCTPINIFNLDDPNTIAVLQHGRRAGEQQLLHAGKGLARRFERRPVRAAGRHDAARGRRVVSQGIHALERRYVAADQSGDRQLRARQPVRLGAAGRLQRQGSLRRAVRPDPQGHSVRPRVEPDGRRSLLEVQQLRQHEQRQGRARVASDRRPAAARHGLRSVPCADRRPTSSRRRPAMRRSSRTIRAITTPAARRTRPASNVPTDGSFVNQHVASAACRSTGIASGSQFAGFPLGPEFGKSFDWGIVYDPHFIDGLSVSADFWRLYLNNNITASARRACSISAAAGQLGLLPADPSLRVRRPNQGQIDFINEPTGNLGRVDVKGVDFALNYRLPEFSFGRFNVGLNATYLEKYDISTAPGTDAQHGLPLRRPLHDVRLRAAARVPGCGRRRVPVPALARAERRSTGSSARSMRRGACATSAASTWVRRRRRRTCSRPARATTATTARSTTSYIDYGATVYQRHPVRLQPGSVEHALRRRREQRRRQAAAVPLREQHAEREHRSERLRSDGPLYWGRVTVKF